MSGNVWMFSDEIDDEDLEFMRHDYRSSVFFSLSLRANTTDWESNPLSVWHMKQGQYIKLGKRC